MPWPLQFVLFGVLGVVALILWRSFRPEGRRTHDQPTLNQRGVHYIGQVFTLVEPIVQASARSGSVTRSGWRAGGDAPPGARVRVMGVNGTVLQVEPA